LQPILRVFLWQKSANIVINADKAGKNASTAQLAGLSALLIIARERYIPSLLYMPVVKMMQ
jgi:hypothetical protein